MAAIIRMGLNSRPLLQFNTSKTYHIENGVLVIDKQTPLILTRSGMVGSFEIQLNPDIYWAASPKQMVTWYNRTADIIPGFTVSHRQVQIKRLLTSLRTGVNEHPTQPMLKLASNIGRSHDGIQGVGSKAGEVASRLSKFQKKGPPLSVTEFSSKIEEADHQIEDINAEFTFALQALSFGFDVKLSKDPDLMLEKHRVEVKRIRGIYTFQKQKALEEEGFVKQRAEILAIQIEYSDPYFRDDLRDAGEYDFRKAIKTALVYGRREKKCVVLFGHEFWHRRVCALVVRPIL